MYVRDHAIALQRVLETGKIGETYAIGGNNEQQNIGLVKSICAILDELRPRSDSKKYESQIEFVADRPGHDLRYAIDSSKIRADLVWEPAEDNESGLKKTIQWYLDNEDWWKRILSGDYRIERLGKESK